MNPPKAPKTLDSTFPILLVSSVQAHLSNFVRLDKAPPEPQRTKSPKILFSASQIAQFSVFLSVLLHSKLNIFRFWTIGQTKLDI